MLKVYIEDSAFTEPRPMEVDADAPVAQLVPALVEELDLPRTDLFGHRLIYVLRHATDGWVVPDFSSLEGAEIQPGTHLALVSYIEDEFTLLSDPVPQVVSRTPAFYADQTIADVADFKALSNAAPLPSMPYVPNTTQRVVPSTGGRYQSRRAFFLLGGAVLGAAGLALGYEAFRILGSQTTTSAVTVPHTTLSAPRSNATPTPQPFIPTKFSPQLVFTQHQQTVRAVRWSPDGSLLASGGNDRLLLTWNVVGQVQLRKQQNNTVAAVAWSPDARQLAIAVSKQVLFLNAQTGEKEVSTKQVHTSNVTALAWSTQQPQLLVSTGMDTLAIVWNTQTFQPQTLFKLHSTAILSASWATNGPTVGTCSQGGTLRVWNGTNGQQNFAYNIANVQLNALAYQPGGNILAVGGQDGGLRLWQDGLACQGTPDANGVCPDMPQNLPGHTGAIQAVAWSPDGRFLASADSNGHLYVWYPAQSQEPLLKITQNNQIQAITWAPNGKQLASASGKTVTLWALS